MKLCAKQSPGFVIALKIAFYLKIEAVRIIPRQFPFNIIIQEEAVRIIPRQFPFSKSCFQVCAAQ